MNAVAQPPIVTPPWRRWGLIATAGAIVSAVIVLFLFDPARYPIYPVCPLHQATGLLCPGCGSLRAVHQLAHGHLAAAWRLNPMFVALAPVGIWLGVRELIWQLTGRRLPGLVTHPFFAWVLTGSLVLFGILRNL
jgi:hypothetical protein